MTALNSAGSFAAAREQRRNSDGMHFKTVSEAIAHDLEKTGGTVYTVQSGDTLSDIAEANLLQKNKRLEPSAEQKQKELDALKAYVGVYPPKLQIGTSIDLSKIGTPCKPEEKGTDPAAPDTGVDGKDKNKPAESGTDVDGKVDGKNNNISLKTNDKSTVHLPGNASDWRPDMSITTKDATVFWKDGKSIEVAGGAKVVDGSGKEMKYNAEIGAINHLDDTLPDKGDSKKGYVDKTYVEDRSGTLFTRMNSGNEKALGKIKDNLDNLSALDGAAGKLSHTEMQNIKKLMQDGHSLDELIADGKQAREAAETPTTVIT